MTKIDELYTKYGRLDTHNMTIRDSDILRKELEVFPKEELYTIEDHKKYIELLAKFRTYNFATLGTIGSQFWKMISSLLAVGEDGVYTNKMRFLYELIQNVDDCDYDDINNCNLEILFERGNEENGKIVLTYNETGFTPANVFAITGIAEAAKNLSEEKVEIGEKGIGFKSVFGIAKKVLIQSGKFSFSLSKDNFIVPVPCYENYKEVQGTKLTIITDYSMAEMVYNKIANIYANKESIIKQNPILCLNKLTHLKIYRDGFDSIEFNVERRDPENISGILFEDNVKISVKIKRRQSGVGNDIVVNEEINCVRYTMPIIYGRQECVSRYGEKTSFENKRNSLVAVIPIDEDYHNDKGILYSFLPTQIEIQAPIMLHVPFKLDGSREYVDPQGKNRWFSFTMLRVEEFVKAVYRHLCGIVRNRICEFIPKQRNDFFYCSNDKVNCLCVPGLLGESIVKERIFCGNDGNFYNADNVVSIDCGELKCNPEALHKLLKIQKKLFVPEKLSDGTIPRMSSYGVEVISKVIHALLINAWKDEKSFDEIANVLKDVPSTTILNELKEKKDQLLLRPSQIISVSQYSNLKKAFAEYGRECISYSRLLQVCSSVVMLDDSFTAINDKEKHIVTELINSSTLNKELIQYLQGIRFKIFVIDTGVEDFYFIAKNGIILEKSTYLAALGDLSVHFDKYKTFKAVMRIRQATETLNSAEIEELSNADYLEKLQDVRSSLINAYGTEVYERYIRMVNDASGNKDRFLNELLQNADDCIYPENEIPTLKMELTDGKLELNYNEAGFTKSNVRSITAIGESTKKKIQTDKASGEKGIGFKSVFEVAEKVIIHSNGFDFSLTCDKPTVPYKCTPMNNLTGTVMKFTMKESTYKLPDKNKVLQLCLCLKKLKHIEIGDTVIDIHDEGDERTVSVNGEVKHFNKYTYNFVVQNKDALAQRCAGHRRISEEQSINFYTSKDYKPEKRYLYSGLPTEIETNVPLIIDAPFELTTARNGVLQNLWNEYIRTTVYEALADFMQSKKVEYGIDILQFSGFKNLSFSLFNNAYLNDFSWLYKLKKLKVLPCLLYDNLWVSADCGSCKIIPDVVAEFMVGNSSSRIEFAGNIINSLNKSQYNTLLQYLGCEFIPHERSINYIQKHVSVFVNDSKLRNKLYLYLSNPQYAFSKNDKIAPLIASLPIFPVRPTISDTIGTRYVSVAGMPIYHHENAVSELQFKVLDTNIMTVELANRILGSKYVIPPLTQDVRAKVYQDNLVAFIKNGNDQQRIAEFLLDEYIYNYDEFSKCKYTLMGLRDFIPMKMADGDYRTEFIYLPDGKLFYGKAIKKLLVDQAYSSLAKYLGFPSINEVSYDAYDSLWLTEMDGDDILDILENKLLHAYEILVGMIDQRVISDELVEKYNLQYYRNRYTTDSTVPVEEEFPGERAHNYSKIKDNISQIFSVPNVYEPVSVIKWQPRTTMNLKSYYKSKEVANACFCQMCKERYNVHYIENVSILFEPAYAWEDLHLSLCLQCANDYRELRKNEHIIENLKKDLAKNNDAEKKGNIEIQIYGTQKTITFTGAHFARVKAIFEDEKKIAIRPPKK